MSDLLSVRKRSLRDWYAVESNKLTRAGISRDPRDSERAELFYEYARRLRLMIDVANRTSRDEQSFEAQ